MCRPYVAVPLMTCKTWQKICRGKAHSKQCGVEFIVWVLKIVKSFSMLLKFMKYIFMKYTKNMPQPWEVSYKIQFKSFLGSVRLYWSNWTKRLNKPAPTFKCKTNKTIQQFGLWFISMIFYWSFFVTFPQILYKSLWI